MNNTIEPEIALLGFLTRKSMHGYDIYKDISDLSGLGIIWRVKTGRLYAMLHKLEEHGYVNSRISQEGNRPQKTQYSITRKGKAVFQEWLTEPVQRGREFRITFLLKLYFTLDGGAGNAKILINRQREECKLWLEKYNDHQIGNGNGFNQIVGSFRHTQIQGYLNWLDWCQKYIEEEEK